VEALNTDVGNRGAQTLVIGKLEDIKTIGANERLLDLPNQGTPKLNWIQNASKLRECMRVGDPIRDASGGFLKNTGFLRAERELLKNHAWEYKDGYWWVKK